MANNFTEELNSMQKSFANTPPYLPSSRTEHKILYQHPTNLFSQTATAHRAIKTKLDLCRLHLVIFQARRTVSLANSHWLCAASLWTPLVCLWWRAWGWLEVWEHLNSDTKERVWVTRWDDGDGVAVLDSKKKNRRDRNLWILPARRKDFKHRVPFSK